MNSIVALLSSILFSSRCFIFFIRYGEIGLVEPLRQILVGFSTDAFLLGLFWLLWLATNSIRFFILKIAYLAFFLFFFLLHTMNLFHIYFEGKNIVPSDFSYVLDVFILRDSILRILSSHLWVSLFLALLFTLSSYIVWTSFSSEPNRNTTNNKNILIIFLITLIFRSVSLSNRLILHEPTETHISTFLAWRLKKIQEFQIQYPEEGFDLLKQHYLKYRHKDAIQALVILQKGTNVVLIILESFASHPMAKKPEIAPFLSSFQKTLGTVRLNNHFAVVQRTVGAQFSLW